MNNSHPHQSAIEPLITRYQQFKLEHFEEKDTFVDLVEKGQKPKVLVIACCDSRVDPAIVTGSQPGELFVVRNIANLVPPFNSDPRHHGTSAALEFGVKSLKVSDIIIFGHSHCGGIRNLIETGDVTDPGDFIGSWMNIAKPAKEHVKKHYADCSIDQQAQHCEKESLLISLNNLMSFPWIKERVQQKELFLHAWYFNLASGNIEAYQEKAESFAPL